MTIRAFVFDAYGTLYDVQGVAAAVENSFPGHGDYVTQVWRCKQLEYTWLRSIMRRYEDLRDVTRQSLEYALATLGLHADEALLQHLVEAYDRLPAYPEVADALAALSNFRLAILSNGSPAMLDALVRHSGLGDRFEAVISVEKAGVFKPDPRAYALIGEQLGLRLDEVVFVSSNGFDVCGAKSCGLLAARIARVTASALSRELAGGTDGPAAMFRALRSQEERLGFDADATLGSLRELVDVFPPTAKPA